MPKKQIILFLTGSTLFIVFFFYTYQILYTPNILVGKSDSIFIITPESTFKRIQQNLASGGFTHDPVSFGFLARLWGYDRHIVPGRYRLSGDMTNLQAIHLLNSGKQEPVKVMFTHARFLSDLGKQITKNLRVSTVDFYAVLDVFLGKHKKEYNAENILTMFIPNTYEIYYDISAEALLDRIYREHARFWNTERKSKADKIGLSPIQVSILASIVQAETVKSDEAPIIAGLYLNRLKKNIPLQADPTLVYAIGDFSLKRVLNTHKKVDSPYNTYLHRGLPPGPINMPGIIMIDAVLNAVHHNYLYMCARADFSGYHHFSSTLQQHLVYARSYQRALTIEQRKARSLRNNR